MWHHYDPSETSFYLAKKGNNLFFFLISKHICPEQAFVSFSVLLYLLMANKIKEFFLEEAAIS